MTDKERAVIDEVINWIEEGPRRHCGWVATRLRYALDAEQENTVDDYKWLAVDAVGNVYKFGSKPTMYHAGKWWRHALADKMQLILEPLSFLKPGQLWERYNGLPVGEDNAEEWNGYWWRLAEDNSKPVDDENPWITDRRPTEEDGDIAGRVFIYEETGPCAARGQIGWNWAKVYAVKDEPWQPVPLSLRVKPVEQKCETCVHLTEHKWRDNRDEQYSVPACPVAEKYNPTYGMDGCVYKPKD